MKKAMTWKDDLSNMLSSYFIDETFADGLRDLADVGKASPAEHARHLDLLTQGLNAAAAGDTEIYEAFDKADFPGVYDVRGAHAALQRIVDGYLNFFASAER